MAYTPHPTVVPGDTWTASNQNTYIKGNLEAIWVGTTGGDMDYYTSSTVKNRLAIGANGTHLESNGSAPIWAPTYAIKSGLLNLDVALQVGDDADRFRIPSPINGWNVVAVALFRQSGTGVPNVQIRNVNTAVNVLSTALSIDSGETDSSTAATPAVINLANDNVSTGQQIAIDVDVAGTSTLRCGYEILFQKP